MSKANNKDAEERDNRNRRLKNETLELKSGTVVNMARLSKPDKDSVVKLKTSPQTAKSLQKPSFSSQIGESLQNAYNDILQQPVPDRFLELLRQLETGQTNTPEGLKKDNQ